MFRFPTRRVRTEHVRLTPEASVGQKTGTPHVKKRCFCTPPLLDFSASNNAGVHKQATRLTVSEIKITDRDLSYEMGYFLLTHGVLMKSLPS